jgi:iron complex transport system ATP-binding protein
VSIRVQGLVYRYQDFELRVPSLDFPGAALTTIVGPNGAGKTTLLKCLSGILPSPRGSVFVDGRDLATLPEAARARRLAYVPQEHSSAFNYAIIDFVLMGRTAYVPLFSTPSDEDAAAALEALDYVGLARYAGRAYTQLSSGERRLVLIARALAQNSDSLVLDEPTTFLDPKHETGLLDLVRRLAVEKKKTVLVTLHNLDAAVKYSDMLVFLKEGRVVEAGRPAEILSAELLERVYDIPMSILEHAGRKFIVR